MNMIDIAEDRPPFDQQPAPRVFHALPLETGKGPVNRVALGDDTLGAAIGEGGHVAGRLAKNLTERRRALRRTNRWKGWSLRCLRGYIGAMNQQRPAEEKYPWQRR